MWIQYVRTKKFEGLARCESFRSLAICQFRNCFKRSKMSNILETAVFVYVYKMAAADNCSEKLISLVFQTEYLFETTF